MLTLILGFIVTFILYRLFHHFFINTIIDDPFVIITLLMVPLGITIGLSISPISGYNDWEIVEEIDLVHSYDSSISTQTEIAFLIPPKDIVSSKKPYEDIEKIESSTCTKPVLRKYKRHAKLSIWTFGLDSQEKYIIYVPKGTHINKITLK